MIFQGGGSVVSRESQGARILSVDVGSSSVRAEIYDDAGDSVEDTEVKLDYEFEFTADGGAVKDADELFDLVVRAVDGTLSKAGGAAISGVAMSTFWHSVLGLDRDGRPTTPIVTWADRRAAETGPDLRERLDESANHRRTGCVLHSSYWPAKLLWSSRAMDQAFDKTERWVSPADYFYARFFGEPYQAGTSMASGTGLFDQNRRRWDRETLEALAAQEAQLSALSDEARRGLAGERGPGWADRANGTVSGLSMTSKPVEILRAAMEAVAFRFAIIAEMIDTASPGEKEVVASGGGLLNSPTWTRIMADTLGRPITLSGVKESSSRGAALITLEALGGPEIETAQAPLGETFEPDPSRHEIYMMALERQRRLYDTVLGGS